MTSNQPAQFNSYLQQQVVKDIDQRTVNGTYIYFVAWCLIGGGTGFYEVEPLFFWTMASILLIAGLFRLGCYFYFQKNHQVSIQKQKHLQFVNVFIPTSVYSVIFAMTMSSSNFEPLFLYVLMVVFALLSAGTSIFAPRKELSVLFIAVLTIPPILVALLSNNDKLLEATMLSLYSLYMLIQAGRLSGEYLTLIEQQFQLQQLNQLDGLSGIANRRCFDDTLVLFWKTHIRTEAQLSLLLIDIDHFKQVNDTYGHAAGDEVIIEVANVLKSSCKRETDLVARIGGEEFAVLIAINDFEQVKQIAERIRQRIETTRLEHDGQLINFTISIGIANTIPELNKNSSDYYKTADRCLYTAKESGRNRIECESY